VRPRQTQLLMLLETSVSVVDREFAFNDFHRFNIEEKWRIQSADLNITGLILDNFAAAPINSSWLSRYRADDGQSSVPVKARESQQSADGEIYVGFNR
jgi:hypothetical protein